MVVEIELQQWYNAEQILEEEIAQICKSIGGDGAISPTHLFLDALTCPCVISSIFIL